MLKEEGEAIILKDSTNVGGLSRLNQKPSKILPHAYSCHSQGETFSFDNDGYPGIDKFYLWVSFIQRCKL